METLFTWLSESLDSNGAIAIFAAAGWGAASLILSPCHFSSIPLIVGFVSSSGNARPRAALWCSLLFALGILASIVAIGAITVAVGRMAGDIGPWGSYVVAAVLALVGLYLIGLIPLNFGSGLSLPKYHGMWAALLLGLIFGIAVGPCTFAYLAPVLGVVFKVAGSEPLYASALVVSYGIGHCFLIVIAGVSTGAVQKVLDWNSESAAAKWLKRGCGALVICGAAWLAFSAT
jgi:cytochrome c-type biogenesis protein